MTLFFFNVNDYFGNSGMVIDAVNPGVHLRMLMGLAIVKFPPACLPN